MSKDLKRKVIELTKLIDRTKSDLDRIKGLLHQVTSEVLDSSSVTDYSDIPGVEGVFNGHSMIAEDGSTYEVPANYAAKSKLVFGDKLKLIDEDGKKVFKNIFKVDRKSLSGVLTKKEGKWYVLTELGAFKVSDNAIEYNKLELNSEVVVLIPSDNTGAPFATLDKFKKPKLEDTTKEETHLPKEQETKVKKSQPKQTEKSESPKKPKKSEKAERPVTKKPVKRESKPPVKKEESTDKSEQVTQISDKDTSRQEKQSTEQSQPTQGYGFGDDDLR